MAATQVVKHTPSRQTLRQLDQRYQLSGTPKNLHSPKRTPQYKFKPFKEGTKSVGEGPRPGRRSTSTNDDNVESVRAVVRGNRC